MAPASVIQKLYMYDLNRQHHTLNSGKKGSHMHNWVAVKCSVKDRVLQSPTSDSYQYLNCRTSSVYSQYQLVCIMQTLERWDFAYNFPKSILKKRTDPVVVFHSYLIIQNFLSSITGVTSSQQSSLDVEITMTNDVVKRLERLLSTFGSIW